MHRLLERIKHINLGSSLCCCKNPERGTIIVDAKPGPSRAFKNGEDLVIPLPSLQISQNNQPLQNIQPLQGPTQSKTLHILTTPKRKKDIIPKKVRDGTWMAYHGNSDIGICYCCGISIRRYNRGWHCAHVLADSKGGDEIVENMRTCCPHCNLSMGNCNLYVYIREKKLTGPGAKNMETYFKLHPEMVNDERGKSIYV